MRAACSARLQLMPRRRCYTFWVGTSLLLLGALHLVDLKTLPAFCSSCRGEHGCGYTKDAHADTDFDLMHTHMCSLGLHCIRTAAGCSSASGDIVDRLRARALENAALCLAVEEAATAEFVDSDDVRSFEIRAASSAAAALV